MIAIAERILNAFLSTLWHITIGFDEGEAKFTFAAMQLLSSTGSSFTRILTAIINMIITALTGVASWFTLSFAILFFTGLLFIAYEQYPTVARGIIIQYNDSIGPTLRSTLIVPFEAINLFLGALLPIYNTFAWIIAKSFSEGILMPFLRSPDSLLKVVTSTKDLTFTATQSITSYSIATFAVCNNTICMSDIGTRTIDLITPMGHFRDIVAILIAFIGKEICGSLAVPLDILTAPILDINFAKAFHNIINAILWTVLQIPILTEARCRLFSATDGVVMCLPDFGPTFRYTLFCRWDTF
jgi:hypothetical protein